MHHQREQKFLISYCGSYCHQCDWFTGKIKKLASEALKMFDTYNGFRRLLDGQVNADDVRKALEILSNTSICSGCKLQIADGIETDRCDIRRCCFEKGFDICADCAEFPCEKLRTNAGVIKFNCIENLYEIKRDGIEQFIEKQWKMHK